MGVQLCLTWISRAYPDQASTYLPCSSLFFFLPYVHPLCNAFLVRCSLKYITLPLPQKKKSKSTHFSYLKNIILPLPQKQKSKSRCPAEVATLITAVHGGMIRRPVMIGYRNEELRKTATYRRHRLTRPIDVSGSEPPPASVTAGTLRTI